MRLLLVFALSAIELWVDIPTGLALQLHPLVTGITASIGVTMDIWERGPEKGHLLGSRLAGHIPRPTRTSARQRDSPSASISPVQADASVVACVSLRCETPLERELVLECEASPRVEAGG
jgi:hypothetical protein